MRKACRPVERLFPGSAAEDPQVPGQRGGIRGSPDPPLTLCRATYPPIEGISIDEG
jgi:hypothetical protein